MFASVSSELYPLRGQQDLGFADLLWGPLLRLVPALQPLSCVQAGLGFVPAGAHLNKNDANRVAEAERKQHKGTEELHLDAGQTRRGVKRSAGREATKEQFTL